MVSRLLVRSQRWQKAGAGSLSGRSGLPDLIHSLFMTHRRRSNRKGKPGPRSILLPRGGNGVTGFQTAGPATHRKECSSERRYFGVDPYDNRMDLVVIVFNSEYREDIN
jgi:hypothetical protein